MTDDRNDEERGPASWQLPQERQPDTDAYHIWTPRPLLRSIYWKPEPAPPFEAISATYEIFVDQRAWLTMHEHIWQTPPDRTPFGYLIGDLCEDPNANRRFVNITSALPARFDFHEDAKDQISREATLALQLEVERRRGVLAGWYHRHLGGGEVALTAADVRTHQQHFSDPWQSAFLFVGGGHRNEGGCFRAMPDRFAGDLLLPFYEMASNESLLARGLKRSYLDWSNHTTVDEIRSEPPPRSTMPSPESGAVEDPEAAGEPEAAGKPGSPSKLVVQPFDAEPGHTEPGAEPPDAPAPARPDEKEAKQQAEADQQAEAESVAAEAEEAPAEVEREAPVEAEAPAEAAEAEAPAETAEQEPPAVEAEAAGDEAGGSEAETRRARDAARRARIELDLEEGYPSEREVPADIEREDAADEREVLAPPPHAAEPVRPETRSRREVGRADEADKGHRAATASDRRAEPGREATPRIGKTKVIAAALGAVLVLAAVAAGLFMLLGESGGPDVDGPGAGQASAGEPGGPGGVGTTPAVTAAEIDSVGNDMLAMISQFYGRAVARESGEATCEELATAFVAVENAWISYNTDYKAEFEGPLPARLAERDDRLYAGVQDAEREFDESGCPRP